jgi:hypothetical protein
MLKFDDKKVPEDAAGFPEMTPDLFDSKPSGEGLHQTKVHRTIARNTPVEFRALNPTIHYFRKYPDPPHPAFILLGRMRRVLRSSESNLRIRAVPNRP